MRAIGITTRGLTTGQEQDVAGLSGSSTYSGYETGLTHDAHACEPFLSAHSLPALPRPSRAVISEAKNHPSQHVCKSVPVYGVYIIS